MTSQKSERWYHNIGVILSICDCISFTYKKHFKHVSDSQILLWINLIFTWILREKLIRSNTNLICFLNVLFIHALHHSTRIRLNKLHSKFIPDYIPVWQPGSQRINVSFTIIASLLGNMPERQPDLLHAPRNLNPYPLYCELYLSELQVYSGTSS